MEQSKADFDTLLKKQTSNPVKLKAKDSLTRRTNRQMLKN
jgi:hypothetical protein